MDGFFLEPQVWRWISGSSFRRSSTAIRVSVWMLGVAMALVWSLVLCGFLIFWMPCLWGKFAP